MGFRITDRDERRRVEEARKIIASRIDRHRKFTGGMVDYDEVKLQQELITKVDAIRQRIRKGDDAGESMARLKEAIASVPMDADSLFQDLEPEIILALI